MGSLKTVHPKGKVNEKALREAQTLRMRWL